MAGDAGSDRLARCRASLTTWTLLGVVACSLGVAEYKLCWQWNARLEAELQVARHMLTQEHAKHVQMGSSGVATPAADTSVVENAAPEPLPPPPPPIPPERKATEPVPVPVGQTSAALPAQPATAEQPPEPVELPLPPSSPPAPQPAPPPTPALPDGPPPAETAVCIVGALRIGVIDEVAKHIRDTLITPINADVFACVDDSVYDELPAGSVPGQPNYRRPSPNFEFVAKDGWGAIYPTLRAWKSREKGSVTPFLTERWSREDAPCMPQGDNGRTASRFRLFYPQFAGYECCLRMVEKYEAEHSMRYKYVVKSRPDISIDKPIALPPEMLAASADAKLVVGAPYYHRHLMCDMMMMATRDAAEALFTVHQALKHCDTLKVGGQQCCGGQVNEKNWKPPKYCLLPWTMANETECMVDRWLRHNDVEINHTLDIPGGIHLMRWRYGNGYEAFVKTFKELARGPKSPAANLKVLQKYDRLQDWQFRSCEPEGFTDAPPWRG